MQIGSYYQNNFNNFSELFKLFERLKSGQAPVKTGMVEVAPGYFCMNDPKIIANFRKNFDEDGDLYNSMGIAGLDISHKDPSEWHKIIGLSEDGKQKLFDMVKTEFLQEDGVLNGDTTKVSEVYADYYRSIPKADRLKAGWSLQQLEREYRASLISAVRAENPNWEAGDAFDHRILENVTRESVSGGEIDMQTRMGLDTRA